jgi:MFS transporter, DHA1 family, tetracycline resistance protein
MQQKSLLPLILTTAFLDLLGFSLFIPVLPDITAHFGQAESWTMWAQSIYSLGMFLAGAAIWNLSDKYGRKNLLIYTTSINIIGYIITYLAIHTQNNIATFGFWLYLFARLISGVAWSGFWVVQAYISDISTSENRAKNMGLIGAAFGTAFLVGPALGWVLATFFGIEWILLLSIALIFGNLIWIVFWLPEPQKHQQQNMDIPVGFSYTSKIYFFLTLSLFATIGFSVIQSGSVQYSADRFGFDADMRWYSLAVVGIVSILFQWFLIKYVRRLLSEIHMMLLWLTLLAFGMIFYALNPFALLVFFLVIFFPLGMGMFNPSLSSQLSGTAPLYIGKVMGLNTSVTGIGGIIGPLLVGWLYAHSITLPFWVSAGLFGTLACITFLYFYGEKYSCLFLTDEKKNKM